MAHKALDNYLNDHLGGSMLGSDLANQIGDRAAGTPLGDLMERLAPEIEQDRDTLSGLMDQLGTSRNVVKEAGAWVTEKASRVKFGGTSSGEPDFGLFMALETLTLGVEGKLSLWKVLKQVEGDHPALTARTLDDLIDRAQGQHDALEHERVAIGARVLGAADGPQETAP